jgi:hypothetical protein
VPAAPFVPEEFRDLLRIPVARYSEAFGAGGRITVRTRWKDAERCSVFELTKDGEQAVVRLSYEAGAPLLTLTPFAFDPVTQTRYFAAAAGEARWGLRVSPGHPASVEASSPAALRVSLSSEPDTCPTAETRKIQPSGRPQMVYLQVTEAGSDEIIDGPGFGLLGGQVGGSSSHFSRQEAGQERTLFVNVFLFPDSRHVVAALIASAIWRDPVDGKDYVYSQAGSQKVPTLVNGETGTLSTLPAGVATPRALELRFRAENPAGMAPPATPATR